MLDSGCGLKVMAEDLILLAFCCDVEAFVCSYIFKRFRGTMRMPIDCANNSSPTFYIASINIEIWNINKKHLPDPGEANFHFYIKYIEISLHYEHFMIIKMSKLERLWMFFGVFFICVWMTTCDVKVHCYYVLSFSRIYLAPVPQDVDYVLSTGDLVPHHIWKITPRENIAIMREMTDLLLEYFPNLPIYGAIGNHESFPRDSFPPPESPEVWSRFGVQWLYDAVADQWSRLMGSQVPPTARFAGYYSVLARPGLRIISINTNYCYRLNWWLLYKSVDPGMVLRWLVSELQQAESRGEVVHIIGHIPPFYSDCFAQWAHQFSRIVSRYAHIIRGQFYGHSHQDEFRVHYDVNAPNKPIGVQYVSPNNGPFHDLNPSYRVFYIDGDHPETTRNVLDYETWVMNLTHANKYDAPHWYQLYTARRDLQLPSLDPRHWDQLVQRMARDPQLFARYHRYQVQDSDSALSKGCDAECRRNTLCAIVEGDKFMPRKCRPHD
nr:sphingomyelin phosphodiesterase-like [Penaeus vannamei]